MFKALKVSVAILNLIRVSVESQWSLFKVNELETRHVLLCFVSDSQSWLHVSGI